MRIGVTTGIYGNHMKGILETIEFASGERDKFVRAEAVEVLVTAEMIGDAASQAEIAKKARESKIRLITRIDPSLDVTEPVLKAHAVILKYQPRKKVTMPQGIFFGRPDLFAEAKSLGIMIYVENMDRGLVRPSEIALYNRFVKNVLANQRIGCCINLWNIFYQAEPGKDTPHIVSRTADAVESMRRKNISVMYRVAGYGGNAHTESGRIYPGSPADIIPYAALFKKIADERDLAGTIAIVDTPDPLGAAKGIRYFRFLI